MAEGNRRRSRDRIPALKPYGPRYSPATKIRSSRLKWDIRSFRTFAKGLQVEGGKPLTFYPEQRQILEAVFRGVTELVVIIPKKNGKTTLLAALALFHLEVQPGAEAIIGASSRDQATILFNQAVGLVRRSGLEHLFNIKTGYREIRANGGRLRVLAADADTADGVIPTLALVDELHRHRSGDLYGVFRDGLLGSAQMVTISTAGYDEDSPLGVLRARAHGLPSFRRVGVRNHAVSPDGTFELFEWCLSPEDDLEDLKLVKRVNPAPWHTRAALKRRRDTPSMTDAAWARFACGVWTFGEQPWLSSGEWDALRVDIGGIEPGDPVWIHVTANVEGGFVAIASPRPDGAVAVSGLEGDWTLAALEDVCKDLADTYDVQELGGDRAEFGRSLTLLEEYGIPVEPAPHSAERISIVSSTLYRVVQAKLLRHDGELALREHVLRGTTKDTERGWRFVKTPRSRGIIALAFAVHRATDILPEEPQVVGL